MKQIELQEKRVADLKALADAEDIKATGENVSAIQLLMESLEEPILRVADQTSVIMKSLEKSQHSRLMQWLSSTPFMGPSDLQQEKNSWLRKMVLEPPPNTRSGSS